MSATSQRCPRRRSVFEWVVGQDPNVGTIGAHDVQITCSLRVSGIERALVFEALTRSGLEVTVVCKTEGRDTGARTYLASSLCAFAQEVRYWPLASQEYIDGASAAIA